MLRMFLVTLKKEVRACAHRSAAFAGYVRAAEDWTDSGLKGVGF
jgi:hypothetical protein